MVTCSLCYGQRIGIPRNDVLSRLQPVPLSSVRLSPWSLKKRKPFSFVLRANPFEQMNKTLQSEKKLESTKIPSEIREKVENTIQRLGYRVTVGDVSGKAGVTLAEAEDALKAIAADSLGTLEVSNEGEVVYVFPRDFQSQLRSKSLMLRMEPRLKVVAQTAAWLGRVAFGVFFITTVVSVWLAIFAISNSGDRENNRSHRGSAMSSRFMLNSFDIIRLMAFMQDTRPYDRDDLSGDRLNFMEAVFSYMFGDGNPNQDFDDRRWNMIGNYIRSKGGVVIAEELAPFLDLPENAFEESMVVDEGYVLPVLTRFEGEPVVNDEGQLAYVFPKLQTTGVSWFGQKRQTTPSYLREQKWEFSKASQGQLGMVIFFAVANVIGTGVLKELVMENIATGALVAPGLPLLLSALQVYAWSFFVFPIVRWFLNRSRNKTIDERNRRRMESATKLSFGEPKLRRKLENSQKLAKRKFVDRKDVIYSSSKDIEEQAKRFEEEDFDRRLEEMK